MCEHVSVSDAVAFMRQKVSNCIKALNAAHVHTKHIRSLLPTYWDERAGLLMPHIDALGEVGFDRGVCKPCAPDDIDPSVAHMLRWDSVIRSKARVLHDLLIDVVNARNHNIADDLLGACTELEYDHTQQHTAPDAGATNGHI